MAVTSDLSLDRAALEAVIARALAEDVGSGDLTTNAIVPVAQRWRARLLLQQPGVVAGVPVAEAVFRAATKTCSRNVGIAECDYCHPAPGQRRQEVHRTGSEFLKIVNDDQSQNLGQCVLAPHYGQPRSCDQFGRVEMRLVQPGDHRAVFGGELARCDPLGNVMESTEPSELGRRYAVFGRAHQQLTKFGAKPAECAHVSSQQLWPDRPGAISQMPRE